MKIRFSIRALQQMIAKIRAKAEKILPLASKKTRVLFRNLQSHYDAAGYYAVLLLVLTALASAAYAYRNGGFDKAPAVNLPQTTPDAAVAVQSQPIKPASIPEEKMYILPVEGDVLSGFSADELVWSETLGMWQTHPAIDLAASGGEAVLAAADGEVVEAYSDALYGNTIAIDHGDGCIIRYASLNTLQMVEIGRKVKRGDVISSVGDCSAEAELGAHLHIECYENGEPVDFLSLVQKN